jgi:hypothetical protein
MRVRDCFSSPLKSSSLFYFCFLGLQRLAAKDLDDWEQRRVKRLPGEPDGVL